MKTAWWVSYGHGRNEGLYITGAWFKKGPNEPWLRVLWDARLSEIFVPYHSGKPRYRDLSMGFNLINVTQTDAGPYGKVLDEKVVKEVRNRGILWKKHQDGRRGQELVLWGTLKAGNYDYIMEYSFRDDGSIGFRLGATAVNLPRKKRTAHVHHGLWRVDMDLGGSLHDRVEISKHQNNTSQQGSTDTTNLFNGGQEGGVKWNDLKTTELKITDTQKTNSQGSPIGYVLSLPRRSTIRNVEAVTQEDFWVSQYSRGQEDYFRLKNYVQNRENVSDSDIVLWCKTSAHHRPRDEDFYPVGPQDGVALTMWSGFNLVPENLFGKTPLFP